MQNPQVVNLLIQNHADVNVETQKGVTPLLAAIERKF
ncbi:MAG: hypothetical protein ISN64_01065 [Rickettsia sp.]|nr:hypothetical protein [Rickettsia sp.]